MNVGLTDLERGKRRQWLKQWRDNDGYVKVMVMLLLDKGCSVTNIAHELGLDEATVYCYAHAFTTLGLAGEQPGYWGLLTSIQLAPLCWEIIDTTFYRTKGQLRAAALNFFNQLSRLGSDLPSLLIQNSYTIGSQLSP